VAAGTALLIAFDGSAAAVAAVRTAGALFPGARAAVLTAHTAATTSDEASAAAPRHRRTDAELAPRVAALRQAVEADAGATAEEGAGLARRADLQATAETAEEANVAAAIRAAVRRLGADLIVCGKRGRGGFSRAVLGSVSSSLLYHADHPVLVVPEGGGDLTGPLLIGYDDSASAHEAVAVAGRLFGGREAIVANVWESPIRETLSGKALLSAPVEELRELTAELDEWFGERARETAETGAALAREHGLAARPQAVEARSPAWRGLVAAARSAGAAVIVAGSRGRGGVASTILGSVSAGLVHNADLPVLVVAGEDASPAPR
jgi:nucleotide-binding universal stress UspA family protein